MAMRHDILVQFVFQFRHSASPFILSGFVKNNLFQNWKNMAIHAPGWTAFTCQMRSRIQ